MKNALAEISPFDKKDTAAKDKKNFVVPDRIVTAVIDPLTGLLATKESKKMVEFFNEGSVPNVYSTDMYRNLLLEQQKQLAKIKQKKKKKKKKKKN
jgi:membrane carboxypeptidase/penicillin-binding protein